MVSLASYGLSVMYVSMAYDYGSHELDCCYCCDGSINADESLDWWYLKHIKHKLKSNHRPKDADKCCLPLWFWYKWCECEWGTWCWCVWGELIVLIGVCNCCWLCDLCIWWWCCCWCCCGGGCCECAVVFSGFKFRTHIVFSRCHTNTLWTMAQPQNTIPMPINTLVIIAGVEWNCVKVYRMIPISKR